MPSVKLTVHKPPADLAELFGEGHVDVDDAAIEGLYRAVAAQPGMTLGKAIEFAFQQYAAQAKHFTKP